MPATATLTIELTAELATRLAQLAAATHRSQNALAIDAIAAYVANEADIIAGIERGMEDMRAGRLITHEEAMARLECRVAQGR